MPDLQTSHDAGAYCATIATAASASGILRDTGRIEWCRADWAIPVGVLAKLHVTPKLTRVGDVTFNWTRVHIPALWLGYRATLLLLQGQPLSSILLPGHTLRAPHMASAPAGHVLLRVDPWEYWAARPCLSGLVLANLHEELPLALTPEEVLGALAADSNA